MKLSIIVAASDNDVIGRGNTMPWKLSEDLKFFKKTTIGKPVLMGRKTFESIGRPLPGRLNIVVSRNKNFQVPEGVLLFDSITDGINRLEEEPADERFIIGGAEIYKSVLPIVDRIYLTRVHCTIPDGDAYFPQIDPRIWKLVESDSRLADEKNDFNYTFQKFEMY
jgi:dihydrofolate reductase